MAYGVIVVVMMTAAVELSVEWLWEVREKLLAYEYFVLLATVSYCRLPTCTEVPWLLVLLPCSCTCWLFAPCIFWLWAERFTVVLVDSTHDRFDIFGDYCRLHFDNTWRLALLMRVGLILT